MHAERVAKETDCIVPRTVCFTFQSIGFMRIYGSDTFGVSDVYPRGVLSHQETREEIGLALCCAEHRHSSNPGIVGPYGS